LAGRQGRAAPLPDAGGGRGTVTLRRLTRGLFGGLIAAQVAYPRVSPARRAAATRGIVALMLVGSAAEAVAARGRRGGVLLAAAGVVGLVAEHVGIRTGRPFGRYAYGDGLGIKVGGVPVLAAAAWAMMARPAWVVAGLVDERVVARVPLAAGALTAWDVFLDPRMVAEGFWAWEDGGAFEDVPLSNFAGWFATAAVVFALWATLDRDDEPATDGGVALALYTWTWLGETFANAVYWHRPKVAVAGSVAMGAFAVPALWRWATARRGRG
jgi:uncharacterized membrane protein